jgi:hypothetical protein
VKLRNHTLGVTETAVQLNVDLNLLELVACFLQPWFAVNQCVLRK